MPHQSRTHQCRAAGDCTPEPSPKQFGNVSRILLPSLLHMLCAIVYQDSHGSSSAIQCKDIHQRHFMDGYAITHLCKPKYFCLLDQLSLV
jgi:hypothetical protein